MQRKTNILVFSLFIFSCLDLCEIFVFSRNCFDLRREDTGRNGGGFIPEAGMARGHSGLQDTLSRMAEAGVIYRLESSAEEGTVDSIFLQL